MASFKNVIVKLNAWRRYRESVRELSKMNDHELNDIGISRCDIEAAARQAVPA